MTKEIVLVAGGAGFIGSHLVDSLVQSGETVHVYDNFSTGNPSNLSEALRGPVKVFREDVVDLRDQSAHGERYKLIFNLACPASPKAYQADPIATTMTNVIGTRNLLELALAHRARFVQASTSEVYGDPVEHPQRESYHGNVNTWGPRACYDEGKRCAETLCHDYAHVHSVDVRVARIFNTYGERMSHDDGRIVSNFVSQALREAPLTVYGDGSQTRSFCYVSDMVRGLRMLADAPAPWSHGPVNLGNSGEFTIMEVAETLSEWFPKLLVEELPLPKDDPKVRKPDLSLAEKMLGYRPEVRFADGLKMTVDWMRERLGR